MTSHEESPPVTSGEEREIKVAVLAAAAAGHFKDANPSELAEALVAAFRLISAQARSAGRRAVLSDTQRPPEL